MGSAPRAIRWRRSRRRCRGRHFRADIEAVTETKPEESKSNAGRKPYDAILKFKIVVLQCFTICPTSRLSF